jgi:phage shock protein E
MKRAYFAIAAVTIAIAALAAPVVIADRRAPPPNAQVDYNGFVTMAREIEPYRADRLLEWDAFAAKAKERGALILDARSAEAYAEGHIDGAVNLPLPDFNDESLREVIGANTDRQILIYCNNNFSNNARPVPLKRIQLALNIQTFINLYGYGYRNVYELQDIVDFNDAKVNWVTS